MCSCHFFPVCFTCPEISEVLRSLFRKNNSSLQHLKKRISRLICDHALFFFFTSLSSSCWFRDQEHSLHLSLNLSLMTHVDVLNLSLVLDVPHVHYESLHFFFSAVSFLSAVAFTTFQCLSSFLHLAFHHHLPVSHLFFRMGFKMPSSVCQLSAIWALFISATYHAELRLCMPYHLQAFLCVPSSKASLLS